MSPAWGWSQTETDEKENNEYGTLEGQVLDAETNAPVNEPFYVNTYYYYEDKVPRQMKMGFKSDKTGYFSKKLKPGKYCVNVSPLNRNTKYCLEPTPDLVTNQEELNKLQVIEIVSVQTTDVTKYAYLGGNVNIRIVDESGEVINFRKKYSEFLAIRSSINSKGILRSVGIVGLKNGTSSITALPPAVYNFHIMFDTIGYGDVIFDLEVKAGQTINKEIIVDMSNDTGIEGIVYDEAGLPIEGVLVRGESGTDGFACVTNENGYYRIVNLQSKEQTLFYSYEFPDGSITKKYITIIIAEHTIIKKDMILIGFNE